MGGRYGKYGEIKRLGRLRKARRDLSMEPQHLREVTGKARRLRRKPRHKDLKGS
jgi:hypothetical protein